jgi:hypothetical protein
MHILTNNPGSASSDAGPSADARPKGIAESIHAAFALALETGIEWMVRITGRKIRKKDAPWLDCAVGTPGLIGSGVYQRIAEAK